MSDDVASIHSLTGFVQEFSFTEKDFRYISDFIYRTAKIVLKDEKRSMVYSRLVRRLRYHKFTAFSDYITFIQKPEGRAEVQELINAITTNLTSFFRENHHFEHLGKTALPEIMQARKKTGSNRLRLWSAGCSSGQEPYSIAMTALHAMPEIQSYDAKILATDLDTHMVSHAETGVYAAASVHKEVPKVYQQKFCKTLSNGDIAMNEQLKDLILFKQLNLHEPWPVQGMFDIIFCRNVVIYFDKETQSKLFHRFAEVLAPDGYLYIGHSESLYNVCDRFKLLNRTIYSLEK